MKKTLKFSVRLFCSLCLVFFFVGCDKTDISVQPQKGLTPQEKATYTTVEWTDLLPDEDLYALENPPEYLEDIQDGSEEDVLVSGFKATPSDIERATSTEISLGGRYEQALISKNIRPEFDGRKVRIPGFIVPLESNDFQKITTFFLVPFFGACLHMPPPPPNQIVYAEFEPGMMLDALYDPFWITGTLHTTLIENDLATAAYSISVLDIEPYTEFAVPDAQNRGEEE